MAKRIAAILAVYVLLAGCASKENANYQHEGVQYGTTKGVFHGRWWNYYERGSSYLSGKYYAEAMSDLRQALAGRGSDTWRARTYGLHFVEYFPNRELGVAYFEQGNLEEAERYLEISLKQIDTERAHYYLDLVKKARIANGSLKDESEPEVDTTFLEPEVIASNAVPTAPPANPARPSLSKASITGPLPDEIVALLAANSRENMFVLAKAETPVAPVAKPAAKPAAKPVAPAKPAAPAASAPAKPANVVTEPVIPVQVAAKDDVGVIKVAVNGKQLPQRGSAQALKFRDDITVKEGTQKIEVIATDLADKQTKKQVEVVVDMTGPTIGVFSPIEPTVTPDGSVTLDGSSTDKTGVSIVAVGERRIAEAQGSPKLPFNTSLPLGNGENVFVVAAKDVGGNETRSAVKVFRGDPNSREAKLWLLKQKRADLFLFASNGTGDLDELLRIAQNDARKRVNEIRLKSPAIDKPYRHNRTLRISGDVFTDSAVQSLAINGIPVNEISGAPKESFNRRLAIDADMIAAGHADIDVVAVTTKGETIEKKFTVALAPVDLAGAQSRMPVAVLAFAGTGVDASVADSLRTGTETALTGTERFNALGKAQLQGVYNEQQLNAAFGSVDEAIGLGAKSGAQVFLVGDVFPHGDKGLELKVRAVDSSNGDLAGTLDAYIEDKTNAELVKVKCADIAAQLAGLYPRLSGEVTSVSGNQVNLNWNAEDGVRPGAYVVLLQQTEAWTDKATGELLEPGELREAARARVDAVSAGGVRATIIERKEEGAPVEQGMPAITM